MRRFRSFNHSACKTVLNLLEVTDLRLRKIVVERVTVVKFRVDNRGSNRATVGHPKSLVMAIFQTVCIVTISNDSYVIAIAWTQCTNHTVHSTHQSKSIGNATFDAESHCDHRITDTTAVQTSTEIIIRITNIHRFPFHYHGNPNLTMATPITVLQTAMLRSLVSLSFINIPSMINSVNCPVI